MPGVVRRHHYIPQFYLAGFTRSGNKDDRLWVIDTHEGRIWPSSPANVAVQRDFYRVNVPRESPDMIEKGLAQFEAKASEVLKNIETRRALPDPGTDDFLVLMSFVALMTVRIPSTRDMFSKPIEQVLKMLNRMLVSSP